MDSSVLLAIGGGAVAVLFAVLLTVVVLRQPPGNARMIEIASAIQEGATAYLNRQYTVIAVIGVVVAVVIGLTLGWVTAILCAPPRPRARAWAARWRSPSAAAR